MIRIIILGSVLQTEYLAIHTALRFLLSSDWACWESFTSVCAVNTHIHRYKKGRTGRLEIKRCIYIYMIHNMCIHTYMYIYIYKAHTATMFDMYCGSRSSHTAHLITVTEKSPYSLKHKGIGGVRGHWPRSCRGEGHTYAFYGTGNTGRRAFRWPYTHTLCSFMGKKTYLHAWFWPDVPHILSQKSQKCETLVWFWLEYI